MYTIVYMRMRLVHDGKSFTQWIMQLRIQEQRLIEDHCTRAEDDRVVVFLFIILETCNLSLNRDDVLHRT